MLEISFGVLAVLILLGVPIAFALMASTIIFFVFNDLSLVGFAHRTVVGSENFVLTAVPFFVFAAVIMNSGGLTRRIIAFADSLIGHWPGSLAQVNIGASMINSGITGSSLADAAGVGSIVIPEMVKKGYSRPFSAVITAASATIGPGRAAQHRIRHLRKHCRRIHREPVSRRSHSRASRRCRPHGRDPNHRGSPKLRAGPGTVASIDPGGPQGRDLCSRHAGADSRRESASACSRLRRQRRWHAATRSW